MSGSKPSPFNRPAWAATKNSTAPSSDKSVFGQHHVYDDILAAQRKKQEEREARHKLKAEKQVAKEEKDVEQPATKKRRLSKESSPGPSDSESSQRSSPSAKATTPEPSQPVRHLRSTPQKDAKLVKGLEDEPKRRKPASIPTVISLDQSDDDGGSASHNTKQMNAPINRAVPSPKRPRKSQPLAVLDEEEVEEDPFLRELQRKAREKAQQRQKEKDSDVCRTKSPSAIDSAKSPALGQADRHPATPALGEKDSEAQFRAPNVAILIKTSIPGTKDLVINRHSSQVLQQVREYWTQRHKLEPDLARQVFFTWRGTRLYNSSTTQSLINILKRERGIPLDSDEDPSNGKIQIDAVTQEILDQQARTKAELAAAAASAQIGAEEGDDDEAPKVPSKKEGIVLILKCKDVEDMPLRVRPNTSIGKIMRAFQSQRHIDRAKKCWLVFDGDRLEENMTAQSAGFEDGEQVEVHPR